MRYLKRFNEGTLQYLTDVRNSCNDILLDMSDKGFKYEIYGFERHRPSQIADIVRIEIGEERNIIKLKEFETDIRHLLSYLKEEGFKLASDSYCMNDSWDYYECCPECGSIDLTLPDLNRLDGWICNKCEHEGNQDNFQSPEHPVTMKDLKWFIKNNYYVQFMSLNFTKSKLSIINCDAFQYQDDKKYDTIYFDLWPLINEQAFKEMKVLSERFSKNLNEGGWMDSWCSEEENY